MTMRALPALLLFGWVLVLLVHHQRVDSFSISHTASSRWIIQRHSLSRATKIQKPSTFLPSCGGRNAWCLQAKDSSTEETVTAEDNSQEEGGEGETNDANKVQQKFVFSKNPFVRAVQKFKRRPVTYLIIPCVAAVVGWVTNWMAVQMIFYPIQFRGIPIFRRPEVPLGFIGWQGIVPCKTRPMSQVMVHMVTTQLLSMQEVFQRLDPRRVAELLAPEVPKLADEVMKDLAIPRFVRGIPSSVYNGLSASTRSVLQGMNLDFLRRLTQDMQKNIDSIFNIEACVVNQMLQDRTLLGQLFKKCGQKELDFLTNSGLWFGFLLGVIQMIVALFWENPWSLSIGGAIVGYATNWLALKWIFEPVNPTKVGPFILQGQFLRRQKEVAKEFSNFFANRILQSKELWKSMLNDPTTSPAFGALFTKHFRVFLDKVSFGLLRYAPEPETIELATRTALARLPDHVHVLHNYVDRTLGLEESLRIKMEQMTSIQFERVLHPIFEEDELTLILAGAALGFAAGLVQQGLETGQIQLGPLWESTTRRLGKTPVGRVCVKCKDIIVWTIQRIIQKKKKNDDTTTTAATAATAGT